MIMSAFPISVPSSDLLLSDTGFRPSTEVAFISFVIYSIF